MVDIFKKLFKISQSHVEPARILAVRLMKLIGAITCWVAVTLVPGVGVSAPNKADTRVFALIWGGGTTRAQAEQSMTKGAVKKRSIIEDQFP